jgi:hypothetical protein
MLLVHNDTQILAHDLVDDTSIRLYNLSYYLATLEQQVVDLHGLVVHQHSIPIGKGLLFVVGNLDDTLACPHCHLHSSILEE